jgi:hypothetical protein
LTILLSNNGCSPSLYQLERYELAQSIEKGYLIVTLKNHSEEIMLLKKYGQHKKAERIARRDAKYNSNLKEAISKNYHYSEVLFTYCNKHSKTIAYETLTGEAKTVSSSDNLFNLSIQKTINELREREQETLTLKITPYHHSYMNTSDLTIEANVSNNTSGYEYLLKKINAKLYRLSQEKEEKLTYEKTKTIQ